jgi:phosphoheptose isomerase
VASNQKYDYEEDFLSCKEKNKMKIFQIVTISELGGAQSVVANLSNALAEEHDVTVIAGEGDGKMFQMLNAGIKCVKLHCLKRKISPLNDLVTLVCFLRLYLQYKHQK